MRLSLAAFVIATTLAACAAAPELGPADDLPVSRLDTADLDALAPPTAGACTAASRWTPVAVTAGEVAGRTHERWRRHSGLGDTCPRTAPLNLVVDENAPGVLDVTVLLPGLTETGPDLQRAVTPAVLRQVPDTSCRTRWIVDTVPDGDAGVERWTVRACDEVHQFRLTFAKGAAPVIERLY